MNLRVGEEITACWPVKLVKDCAVCVHCHQPAFRIVQISNQFGQRRYVSLCSDEFMKACTLFPDLIEVDIRGVLAHVR